MKKYLSLLGWVALVGLFYFLATTTFATADKSGCPYETAGNPNGKLTVKYFGNPFCVYCWIEEPVLETLIEEHGDKFFIEKYDNRYCTNETRKYNILGVPAHVLQYENKTKEFVQTGMLDELQWRKILCELADAC